MSFLQEFTSKINAPNEVSFKDNVWKIKTNTFRQYYKEYLNDCGLNNNITANRFNMEIEGMEEMKRVKIQGYCYFKFDKVVLYNRLLSEDQTPPVIEDNEEGFNAGCLIDSDDETDNL
tara:strand:- start:345 stop:698 length:354 start_codon:yes stop_codon:yes gene_type:complete